jgi:hypothetical protein
MKPAFNVRLRPNHVRFILLIEAWPVRRSAAAEPGATAMPEGRNRRVSGRPVFGRTTLRAPSSCAAVFVR